MERIRNLLRDRRSSPAYEPLDNGSGSGNEASQCAQYGRFSWLEHYVFLLLGISMLWAWFAPLISRPRTHD